MSQNYYYRPGWSLERHNQETILECLKANHGNISATSRDLKVPISSLQKIIRKYRDAGIHVTILDRYIVAKKRREKVNEQS